MQYEVPHFINGEKIKPAKHTLAIYNPASGEQSATVGIADAALVDKAVNAARTAFVKWSATTPNQRANFMFRFKQLLDQNLDTLAKLVTQEHGKTFEEAKGSVQRGIDVVNYLCNIPNLIKGTFTENVSSGIDSYSMHQPLGVCAGITPFNFPAMIPLWMFPTAVACGNTFILKPSEKDPSCSLLLVELAKQAGLPDGVVNVVNGNKETVDALLVHPDINAISFVGSTPIAEYVYKTAIAHNKRAQAFGGAKNHCIVMPDANMEQTVDNIVNAAYGSAGERCMAISVVVAVGDETADRLIQGIKAKLSSWRIGAGHEKDINMGPLVTAEHREKVKSYIELGKKEGARLIIDGEQSNLPNSKGFYLGTYLFDHVKPSMRIYQEEIFGPVLSIVRVTTLTEGINLISKHEFGNGTAIFTNDGYAARSFAEEVQVGMVGINVPVPVPVAYHSFGGWKRSIFADIGMYGAEAIRFYTKLKTVTSRWFQGEK